ncbi:MAG: hypothetical protein ACRDFY_09670 [Candidatus Limnocylindria bacterium]
MTGDPARLVARELGRRGLAAPARLLIDAHRPLAPLLADAGAALGPLLGVLAGRPAVAMRDLLEDEAAMDRVLDALDDLEERHAKSG